MTLREKLLETGDIFVSMFDCNQSFHLIKDENGYTLSTWNGKDIILGENLPIDSAIALLHENIGENTVYLVDIVE
jgi:hypothetical protein